LNLENNRKPLNEQEQGKSMDLPSLNYPASEDIFNKAKDVGELGADSNSGISTAPEKIIDWHDNEFEKDAADGGLDVPGSELPIKIGEEDEENAYYSIGGDAHNNLEEDNEK